MTLDISTRWISLKNRSADLLADHPRHTEWIQHTHARNHYYFIEFMETNKMKRRK